MRSRGTGYGVTYDMDDLDWPEDAEALYRVAMDMRRDEDWWLTPAHNEFVDLKSAEIAGECEWK